MFLQPLPFLVLPHKLTGADAIGAFTRFREQTTFLNADKDPGNFFCYFPAAVRPSSAVEPESSEIDHLHLLYFILVGSKRPIHRNINDSGAIWRADGSLGLFWPHPFCSPSEDCTPLAALAPLRDELHRRHRRHLAGRSLLRLRWHPRPRW